MFRVSFPVHVGRMRFMSIQFSSDGRPVVRKFRFSPEDDPTRLVISNHVSSVRYVISFQSWSRAPIVTNWGKAGLGWRPARPTMAYQGFSNNRHNPVMVYNDLMIRYISVHNYNKGRSQPVTIQCIYTWVGAPVDRRR